MSFKPAKSPPSFSVLGEKYQPQSNWTASSSKFKTPAHSVIFAVSKNAQQKIFVVNTFQGFMVSENYETGGDIAELSTEKMQVTSIDFSPSVEPLVLLTFSLGHILLIDPIRRARGKVQWFNSQRNLYSSRPPCICRFFNQEDYIVLFEDNTMWKFKLSLKTEEERNIIYLASRIRENRDSVPGFCQLDIPKPESNPVGLWKFFCGSIRDVRMSPNSNLFAMINSDGQLRVFDFIRNQHLVCFESYFGGLLSLSWSLDGKLVATGGEDDAVSVWNLEQRKLVYRGEGHSSWVAGVCFGKANGDNYILWSAGEDGKLLIWDINLEDAEASNQQPRGERRDFITHPCRLELPLMEPILEVFVSSDPLQDIIVKEDGVFVCDSGGFIIRWVVKNDVI